MAKASILDAAMAEYEQECLQDEQEQITEAMWQESTKNDPLYCDHRRFDSKGKGYCPSRNVECSPYFPDEYPCKFEKYDF